MEIALEQLQRRHPKLRARIGPGTDGKLCYHVTGAPNPIPFELSDCEEDEIPWREESSRLLHTDLPAEGPMAAVSVVRRSPTLLPSAMATFIPSTDAAKRRRRAPPR